MPAMRASSVATALESCSASSMASGQTGRRANEQMRSNERIGVSDGQFNTFFSEIRAGENVPRAVVMGLVELFKCAHATSGMVDHCECTMTVDHSESVPTSMTPYAMMSMTPNLLLRRRLTML
jgi:hypothetical protein